MLKASKNGKPVVARLRELPDQGVYDGFHSSYCNTRRIPTSVHDMSIHVFYAVFTAPCIISKAIKTGGGTSASRLGMPDLGLASMNDMLDNASIIALLDRNVPLIADADIGYGGPLIIARTVMSYIAAGVAECILKTKC